ncbi:PX domain-containing protein kinase-like protein isoform X2 [Tubulanus polymorphus]
MIKVHRGPVTENSWTVTKRYSDFTALDSVLRIAGYDLDLPPKKMFGNMDREFIAERQIGLQAYLNVVLSYPLLASCHAVKRFFDPQNYTTNFQETALQHVAMIFRSEPTWEVVEPLTDIGWRLRKTYFLVKQIDCPKAQHVLSWCDYGPDAFIPEKEMSQIMKILPTIQHPYIHPVVLAASTESGAFTIRKFHENGTLRDLICKAKPKLPCLKKYGQLKHYGFLSLNNIRCFGKQILEALKFLHQKGLPYGHLHSANIIVEQNQCKLLDIENWCLGVPPYYRQFITQFKKIQSMESMDVYNFGRVLYEMACGEPFYTASCETFPPMCPPGLRTVLESILSTEACKNGLPTVAELLELPFFGDVVLPATDKPVMKIPTKLKEVIKTAKDSLEKRLKDDQKLVSQVRRRSKAEAFHKQEEKKKKRKSKRSSMNNIPENNNGTTSSTSPPSTPVSPTQNSAPSPTSSGGIPTPPPPPPATPAAPVPPPPAPTTPTSPPPVSGGGRHQLLSSISGFSKSGLKKAVTVDKSAPRI